MYILVSVGLVEVGLAEHLLQALEIAELQILVAGQGALLLITLQMVEL